MARFGKYELLSRLAIGGMGETYLADLNAVAGVTKRVVIKKMLPQLTTDAELVAAFVEEARLSASFSHGNIAQVFDFGEVDGEYFLAMEYVHGQSLHQLLKRAPHAGYPRLPYPVTAYIVVELLKALQYAHTRKGPEGKPLGVVHRDVTPENVLISYEGDVKLVDFGVAKSQTKGRAETEPGLVKGKFRYLSPEQATAQPLDARSDLFSTGTVLYELITGQHLFQGQAHVVMNDIVRGSYPSARVKAPDVPDALVDVLASALKKERTERFQSAREMQEALSRWLFTQAADFSGDVVRELMGEVFSAELAKLGTPFVRKANATRALRAMREPPDTSSMRTAPDARTDRTQTRQVWPFAVAAGVGALVAGYTLSSFLEPDAAPPSTPLRLAEPAQRRPLVTAPPPATPAPESPPEPKAPEPAPQAPLSESKREAERLREEARVFTRAKEWAKAKPVLEKCIKLDPAHAQCHKLLGGTLGSLGDAQGGLRAYEKFLELAPDDTQAPAVRALLDEYRSKR